jgi:hypothetical protein
MYLRFHIILTVKSNYFPDSINQLTVVMETSCVFFKIETECLNIIQTSFGFKAWSAYIY